MLKATGISKTYLSAAGPLDVLRDVRIELDRGEAVAVVGPSGSGKTTLLNILGTLEMPTRGHVTIDGVDPFTLTARALAGFRNRTIGFVFQDHHLLPQCTAIENILLPTLAGTRDRNAAKRAHALLERVGLRDRAAHRPAALSGGERQRVALARALINRPRLVLADEPTGNLDEQTAAQVSDLLAALPSEIGATLIVVTHSTALAGRFARRASLVQGTLRPCD